MQLKILVKLKKKIDLGLDLETSKKIFFKIEDENILPDYLNTNRKKYQEWIAK
jgi:hypothetical protein